VLTLASAAFLTATIPGPASATYGASPAVPVEQLDGALLVAMKAGSDTPFAKRYPNRLAAFLLIGSVHAP
jgi:hypothetical protein